MIIGIGIDIIEVNRIAKALHNESFRKRVFTTREIEYCEEKKRQNINSYAARFAAKEAVLKALGTGLREGSLVDIEVLNDNLGKPELILYNNFKALADLKGVKNIYVSLSHSKEYAIAEVILWGDKT